MRLHLRIFLWLFLGLNANANSNGLFPPKLCQELWRGKPHQEIGFDFEKDISSSSDTNKSYLNFVNRIQTNGVRREECHKQWTVLIFMSATEDLLPYAYADLLEMESNSPDSKTGSSARTDIIAHFESSETQDYRRIHLFQDPKKEPFLKTRENLIDLSLRSIQSPIVEKPEPLLEPAATRLKNFLDWGIRNYPAENYLLILWGHGSGYSADPLSNQRGLLIGDYETIDLVTLKKTILEATHPLHTELDVLAYDACHMQNVASTTEVSECTDYVCASSSVESYAGFPYGPLMNELNQGKFSAARNALKGSFLSPHQNEAYFLSWTIPHLYHMSFEPQGEQRHLDAKAFEYLTQSAVSLNHLKRSFLPSLSLLGNVLKEHLLKVPESWIDLKMSFFDIPENSNGNRDIAFIFAGIEKWAKSSLENGNTIESALAIARESLKYTLVHSEAGQKQEMMIGDATVRASGFSIWLPRDDIEYFERIAEFKRSEFFRRSKGWFSFLESFYPSDGSSDTELVSSATPEPLSNEPG